MPNLQHVIKRDKIEEIEVKLEDEILNVKANRDVLTGEVIDAYQEEFKKTQSPRAMAELLSSVIREWDMVADDAGTPFPPTTENLLKLPFRFLLEIMEGLGKSKEPSPEAEGSFATS